MSSEDEVVPASGAKRKAKAKRKQKRANGAHTQAGDTAAELAKQLAAASGESSKEAVARINNEFALLDQGGAVSIWSTTPDARGTYGIYRRQDFELKLNNQYVTVMNKDNDPIEKPLGTYWLRHRARRDLAQVGFWPEGGEPVGVLNLWRGFKVKPEKGAWPTIRKHLKETLCGGDAVAYDYLLKLMAWKIQHPALLVEVAIVMRSDAEGAGKGSFARIFERLFGEHYRHVHDANHVLGDFNDVLIGALVVFLDEALFAHDPRQSKRFMGLVTERRLSLNGKWKPAFSWDNPMLWLVATNNERAIDAARTSRRYFVLDVGDKRVGDRSYFDALHAAIDGEECAALLEVLLSMNLAGWHPRNEVPQTQALARQKIASLTGPASFVHEVLEKGSVGMLCKFDGDLPLQLQNWATQEIEVSHAAVHDACVAWCRLERSRANLPPYRLLLQAIGEMLPRAVREKGKGAAHRRVWVLPPLDECRAHFDAWCSGKKDKNGSVSQKYRRGSGG